MNDPEVLYGLLSGLALLAIYLWVSLTLSALFTKAGERGWKAWVPVYSLFTLFELGGMSGWLVLLGFIPVFGGIAYLVVAIIAYHRVNVSFGHGAGMTVLAVLLFPVWTTVLGWGSSRWLGQDQAPGPRRRSEPALDERIVAAPADPVTAPEAPADASTGATTGGFAPPPSTAAAPASTTPALHRARPGEGVPTQPLDVWDDDLRPGRSHAPWTRTDGSYAPGDEPRAVAATREAFTPARAADSTASQQRAAAQAAMRAAAEREAADRVDASDPDDAPVSGPATASDGSGQVESPAPVQSVPAAPAAPADPWAPPAATPIPDPVEASGEVSAIVASPEGATPRAARASVSAQHNQRELPVREEAFDETIIASRRRTDWMLTPPVGAAIAVTADVLILGRRPSFDPTHPEAQLVPLADDTRTVSKTHARLERRDDTWVIIDLDSTNGVILLGQNGTEVDAVPGRAEAVTERFLLGDAELTLSPSTP